MAYCRSITLPLSQVKSKKGRNRQKKGGKKSLHLIADIFFSCQTFALHGYMVAPTLKMMCEVCSSLALSKTLEFVFTGFLAWYWFGINYLERRQ